MKKTHSLPFSPAARQNIGRALLAGVICWSGLPLYAQNQPPPQPQQAQPIAKALLSQDDLKELVGPIALYPDALIALILPASTVPSDVVLGARYVDAKGDPALAGNQPWDDSVKSLVYYPDVLSWMNQNLEWTASVGEAFVDQPADVMNAIQSLRAQAKASGALTDTPQQRVVVQKETIRIVPADPEVIYVPQYDPEVIFVDNYGYNNGYYDGYGYNNGYGYAPFISFGFGFAVGSWLNYDCDWGNRYVCRGDWIGWDRGGRGWDGGWNGGGDVFNNTNINNTNVNVVNINNANPWNPSQSSLRQIEQRQRSGGGNNRFATAEARAARDLIRAERRANNGKLSKKELAAAKQDLLPAPGKLQVREDAFNRTAKAQDRQNKAGSLAETPKKDRDNVTTDQPGVTAAEQKELRRTAKAQDRQNKADSLPEAPKKDRANVTTDQPRVTAAERKELRKTPTEAPRVSGQLDAPAQARKAEKANEPSREAASTRENVRQKEDRTANRQELRKTPTEAPRVSGQLDAPGQARKAEKANEPSREAASTRQNVRQQTEDRTVNRPDKMPTRAPRIDDSDRPSQRPSVTRQQSQERKADKPQQQQVRQSQQQVRPQQNRPQQRQERPQQQRQEAKPQRQEARPQQKQENRSANRPQQQQPQQQKSEKKSSKSDDSDKKKKD